MSTLLGHSKLEETYEIIKEGSFTQRLEAFYRDIDKNELDLDGDIKLEGPIFDELAKELANMTDKKTLVVSDYDADGIMALSIFLRLLDHLNIDYKYFIPSRTKDGYGLNEDIVNVAIAHGFDYLVTLDNGILAKEAIKKAKGANKKVIVIDHHIFDDLPEADVVVHPDLLDSYHRGMCTAGLVYAISRRYYEDLYSLVLAMIGTIADVVPVYRANRQIIKSGLKVLGKKDIAINIKALYKGQILNSEDVAFKLVPKINAISRLDPLVNVNKVIPYFKDGISDTEMASTIMKINDLRKEKTEVMLRKARDMVKDEPFIIIDSPDFLEGICGIVAGKLADEFKKPCLVLATNGDIYKGSGRVSFDFDIYSYLNEHKDLFLAFGGHERAVGLSIDREGLTALKEVTKDLKYSYDKPSDTLIYISEEDLTTTNMEVLSNLEPFGEGLKRPIFYLDRPSISSAFLIKGLYPKFLLKGGNELFSFNKEHYVEDMLGAIGTLTMDKSQKISMSLRQIVI